MAHPGTEGGQRLRFLPAVSCRPRSRSRQDCARGPLRRAARTRRAV